MSFLLITNLDMVLEHMKEKIGYRWILGTKFKADGSIDRHKAHLVAKGYTQQAGIGLFGNLLTSELTTARISLSIAAQKNWSKLQLDIINGFLNGVLFEEVHMELPLG